MFVFLFGAELPRIVLFRAFAFVAKYFARKGQDEPSALCAWSRLALAHLMHLNFGCIDVVVIVVHSLER